jgi:putative FmdB family regulatory protein
MPIYEFECTKCHHKFDCLLKVDESYAGLSCPSCGKTSPKKLVSSFQTNNWSTFLDKMEKKVSPHKFK